jgi:hypothetical protein
MWQSAAYSLIVSTLTLPIDFSFCNRPSSTTAGNGLLEVAFRNNPQSIKITQTSIEKRAWRISQLLSYSPSFSLRSPTTRSILPKSPQLILDLCKIVGPCLTRLVIDIPLRRLRPEDDTKHVRALLRAAFQELVALEEFVSTQDELSLDVTERDGINSDEAVWPTWPNLKRLALYNVDTSSEVKRIF